MQPSHLFPSPSKFFLLRKLIDCLNQSAGMSIALDVACADFKYRDLFKTNHYVGVDLNAENLTKGFALRARTSDLAVLTNMLNLDKTPRVADVVVSTHTLASLPVDLRTQGALVLADAVLPNGTLFFNIPTESDSSQLAESLRQRFGIVKRVAYGGRAFMAIENYFAYRTGSKNPIVLIAIGISAVLCYLLSFVEDISWSQHGCSYYTLYWCKNRKSVDVQSRMSSLAELSELQLPHPPSAR